MPKNSGPEPITNHHVARQAGVSISTVSKAINGAGQLREHTLDRALLAAHKLGFLQDDPRIARLKKRSYTVETLLANSQTFSGSFAKKAGDLSSALIEF